MMRHFFWTTVVEVNIFTLRVGNPLKRKSLQVVLDFMIIILFFQRSLLEIIGGISTTWWELLEQSISQPNATDSLHQRSWASPCGNGFFNVEISYLRTVFSDCLKLIYSVIDDALPSILDKPKSVPQMSLKFRLVNRRWHKLGPEQGEDAFWSIHILTPFKHLFWSIARMRMIPWYGCLASMVSSLPNLLIMPSEIRHHVIFLTINNSSSQVRTSYHTLLLERACECSIS